ncbi:MAG: diaminopimelate decarboxylase [Myxococcota bacterium]|nr:diaminopimelate decarboxylase [Myxococcota bacterium]MDW8362684.1 diaminopimelate decarboxylase [Myxococcales bacterium]
MTAGFENREGRWWCERVSLVELAAAVGTPAYVYSAGALDAALRSVREALAWTPHLVAYAVKASSNAAIIARLGRAGAGADVVSGGELERVLRAGIPPERVVFSGVGKRDDEIEAALRAGIRSLHVESPPELEVVEAIARRLGVAARIGLRVNPDVDPGTHPYVATGVGESKFGLSFDEARALLPRVMASPWLRLHVVACHVGSQIPSATVLRESVARTAAFGRQCREAGAPLRSLDAGGGWPVDYGDGGARWPNAHELGEAIRLGLQDGGLDASTIDVIVEPGRYLVGPAGALLTRVLYVRRRAERTFVVVDAAMNDLLRPALYGAHHRIVPVVERTGAPPLRLDVVGPVCESGDFLARDRTMPLPERGDLLLVLTAGAYGMSMASQYNSRPRAPEILVEGDAWCVVRDRESLEDLIAAERRAGAMA